MAPSVSTGDGARNVAGVVAEPLDYFHFAEVPDWGLRVGVTARSRNKTCCLGEGNRRGTSIETEGQRLRAGSVKVLQAMSPAKPATDPDSGIFTASMA
ncbi:hypothetical protein [Bradyrhizobium sp. Ec3.3]|uniref:hypothetical protein n=1 Tax=Bradyrhizobium sp. Ec3.3 TaxID=189753 RepID=UPI0012EB5B1F|nr:hypothetical protein [Bradyrhizobium sp. Ec3.3]